MQTQFETLAQFDSQRFAKQAIVMAIRALACNSREMMHCATVLADNSEAVLLPDTGAHRAWLNSIGCKEITTRGWDHSKGAGK